MKRLALICDLHLDTEDPKLAHLDPRRNAVRLLDALARDGEREILALGDLSDSADGLKWLVAELEARGFDFKLMPGNHDVFEAFLEAGIARRPEVYSASRMEGFKVLYLDSRTYFLEAEQIAWMKAELAENRDDLIVFIHHPVMDCGGTDMDRLYPLKNRDEILAALAGGQCDVTVFCGHYHAEVSVRRGGAVQFVSPSALYQIKRRSESGRLEIAHERIGFRILELDGKRLFTESRYLDP